MASAESIIQICENDNMVVRRISWKQKAYGAQKVCRWINLPSLHLCRVVKVILA